MKTPRPRLAIYGGAFNPPTRGHAAAASMLLENGLDRVLVMPCYGHTFGKCLAPARDRLRMAQHCFRHLPRVHVSSFEIDLGLNGSTFDLVRRLPELAEYATHEIFMAIGSDEANQIHRWRRHEELRQLIPFVVIPRVGHTLDHQGAWAHVRPHRVIRTSALMREISSTQVRQALVANDRETLQEMLRPEVLRHITDHRLYPSTTTPAPAGY
ncbi:nicotinic acid mononucleotide adenylyltransferase [Opitutaceae bacterium TAV1]|nr:nicotinic acid mononucleotide adenylyltransferase [Opitutaceae bacterium TAV1]